MIIMIFEAACLSENLQGSYFLVSFPTDAGEFTCLAGFFPIDTGDFTCLAGEQE